MGIVRMHRAARLRAEASGLLVAATPFQMRLPICIIAMDQAATEHGVEGGGHRKDDCNQAMKGATIHWRDKSSYRQDSFPRLTIQGRARNSWGLGRLIAGLGLRIPKNYATRRCNWTALSEKVVLN